MSCISKEEKAKLIAEYGKDANDSGSVEVQIAILTAEINRLNDHLKLHIHDLVQGDEFYHMFLKCLGCMLLILAFLFIQNKKINF